MHRSSATDPIALVSRKHAAAADDDDKDEDTRSNIKCGALLYYCI